MGHPTSTNIALSRWHLIGGIADKRKIIKDEIDELLTEIFEPGA
jgi:hypothetical protein